MDTIIAMSGDAGLLLLSAVGLAATAMVIVRDTRQRRAVAAGSELALSSVSDPPSTPKRALSRVARQSRRVRQAA
jgi:hypothetical protein